MAKRKAQGIYCTNNTRQLTLAHILRTRDAANAPRTSLKSVSQASRCTVRAAFRCRTGSAATPQSACRGPAPGRARANMGPITKRFPPSGTPRSRSCFWMSARTASMMAGGVRTRTPSISFPRQAPRARRPHHGWPGRRNTA
jgi:hypothetical protein